MTMAKFNLRIVQDDSGWTAEIFRKITVKEMKVSRQKDGFASEDEATAWGEAELKSFVYDLNVRKRSLKNEAK